MGLFSQYQSDHIANIKDFGAQADGKEVSSAAMTSGQSTVTIGTG